MSIFLSHRTADLVAAKRLADDLRDMNLTVWLDVDEVRPGDSIVGAINRGLSEASHLIICYSAEELTAPWTSREWMSALARQLDDQGIKLVPVRLTGGIPPAILADIKYADFATNWSQGLSELRRVLVK